MLAAADVWAGQSGVVELVGPAQHRILDVRALHLMRALLLSSMNTGPEFYAIINLDEWTIYNFLGSLSFSRNKKNIKNFQKCEPCGESKFGETSRLWVDWFLVCNSSDKN